MSARYCFRILGIVVCLYISNFPRARSQNNYPASGDALIHGVTIGTGRGNNQISNTALGDSALLYTKAGINNTGAGMQAMLHNSTGQDNTALGYQTLYTNFSGGYNLAAGSQALYFNTSGSYNVGLGFWTLSNNTTGNLNTAIGPDALHTCTTCTGNTALGDYVMYYTTGGSYNTAIGDQAMYSNPANSGNYNTALGGGSNVAATGNPSNTTALGAATATASNSVVIGTWYIGSVGGYANWTNFSDGRYKRNINHQVPGLAFINQLAPITYTLDIGGIESRLQMKPNPSTQEYARVIHTGFIAQDVEKTAKSLHFNFSGIERPKDDQQSFYGLRYSDFVVPLVKAMQELSAENESLKTANAQLSSQLDKIEQLLGIGSSLKK